MESLVLKALLVGICAAVPVGPIFVMAVQRTLCHGRRAGMMVGLGSAAADMVYAAVGLLTLSLVQRLVEDYRGALMVAGGLLLTVIGVSIWRRRVSLDLPEGERNVSGWSCALQAFGSVFSNPAALATMLALQALFGLEGTSCPLLLVVGIGLGEALYWAAVVYLLSRFLRIGSRTLQILSRVAGALVSLFGLILLVRGILMIINN